MAVAIKGFYNMCLERGKKWKLENRKPENPFQQRDTSSARSCCAVSLPLLKPQAM